MSQRCTELQLRSEWALEVLRALMWEVLSVVCYMQFPEQVFAMCATAGDLQGGLHCTCPLGAAGNNAVLLSGEPMASASACPSAGAVTAPSAYAASPVCVAAVPFSVASAASCSAAPGAGPGTAGASRSSGCGPSACSMPRLGTICYTHLRAPKGAFTSSLPCS